MPLRAEDQAIVDRAKKAALCIHIAVESTVADDIQNILEGMIASLSAAADREAQALSEKLRLEAALTALQAKVDRGNI